jgi:hypothetical protein
MKFFLKKSSIFTNIPSLTGRGTAVEKSSPDRYHQGSPAGELRMENGELRIGWRTPILNSQFSILHS